MPLPPYKKWVVVGTTGSGKSTLAEALAARLPGDFIELDALNWEPGWQEAPEDVFRARVAERLSASPAWVVAGNYSVSRNLVWPQAEAVIWLDYPLWTVFWRLTRRTFRRWWTRELLWGTNRENLFHHLKLWSKESLFHWLFRTYWRRKREYPQLLALPEYKHLALFRFASPEETNQWMASLK